MFSKQHLLFTQMVLRHLGIWLFLQSSGECGFSTFWIFFQGFIFALSMLSSVVSMSCSYVRGVKLGQGWSSLEPSPTGARNTLELQLKPWRNLKLIYTLSWNDSFINHSTSDKKLLVKSLGLWGRPYLLELRNLLVLSKQCFVSLEI